MPPRRRPQFRLHLILFLLTVLSTYLTGGFWYCFAIMAILLAHEMGHYTMCRVHGVSATLPYFIPFPLANPFGTMGAVIKMSGFIPSRRALFDIGVAGPLTGFILAVPAVAIGLGFSQVVPAEGAPDFGFYLGESLLFRLLSLLVLGDLGDSSDILLHPLAYAGWAGLFVTALNLLPIGQLDGGHILYSLFGPRSRKVVFTFIGALGALAIVYPGWALLFILLLIFGRKHPAPLDDVTPLDRGRRALAVLITFIFILTFTPIPFKF